MQASSLRQGLTLQKAPVPSNVTGVEQLQTTLGPVIAPSSVRLWKAFNLQNLEAMFGSILDKPQPPRTPLRHPSWNVTFGEDRQRYLAQWNFQVLEPTLQPSMEHVHVNEGLSLVHEYAKPGQKLEATGIDTRSVHYQLLLNDGSVVPYFLGLNSDTEWRGRHVSTRLEQGKQVRGTKIVPLKLLGSLCLEAGTRYGYVQDPDGILICRFSYETEATGNGRKQCIVEVRHVPWTTFGERRLTTDLALWFLSMLAIVSPDSRPIVLRDNVVEIDQMEEFASDGPGSPMARRYVYLRHVRIDSR